MEASIRMLQQHPELSVLVSVALGYAIGAVHWKGIALGTVVGTLVAGICVDRKSFV